VTPSLETLLERTSRTFALSIPVLPEPTRREVMIAYLLFRIADTFEDAAHWVPSDRIRALGEFSALLRNYSPEEANRLAEKWSVAGPSPHEGYRELIANVPQVLTEFLALAPEAVGAIREHVIRSAEGMAGFVRRTRDGRLVLKDLGDLQAYCYVVAGIVGEMLTELFLLRRETLKEIAPYLRDRAAIFGEALQLVNILKDAAVDDSEGRSFLPETVERAEVFAVARRDLATAADYIHALQENRAPRRLVEFTALPVLLARATLDKVEERGPGAKVSRPELFAITQRLKSALDRNERPA
jgi:farnesyl-diphosphate farnesyltransferase